MDGGGPALDAGPHLPCEVDAVLKARCQGCHGAPPTQGAPFPLVQQADFLAPYFTTTVLAAARQAIETGTMPLGGPPLEAGEKAVLLQWLEAGAPRSAARCP